MPPDVFVDNNDGTVTDTATKLLWQKDYATMMTQQDAVTYCQQLVRAGHCDWRLPTRVELGTLVDYTLAPPVPLINAVFDGDMNSFWTASPTAGSSGTQAWVVDFQNGLVSADTNVGVSLDVRCVR